ncbi:MAG: FtsX-like permease family protein [Fidelibacterota bacterium]
MALTTLIALRHLGSRHSLNFISLIGYLSALGLALGTAVLILTLGILNGFEKTVEQKIIGFDGHIRLTGFLGHPLPEVSPALDSVLNRFPEISERAPYIHHAALLRHGGETEGVLVEGISEEKAKSVFGTPGFLTAGHFDLEISPGDRRGLVLGERLAENLGVDVGSRVTLINLDRLGEPGKAPGVGQFLITGLYEMGLKEYDESVVYIDLSRAQTVFDYGDRITGEILRLSQSGRVDPVAQRLKDELGYPYQASTWKERHRNLFAWLSVQKYPITLVFALIALVAVLNIASSLTMIVMEKTRDIGVLRALGYSRRKISRVFLAEGAVIGTAGVLLGVALAYLLGWVQTTYGLLKIPEDVYFMKELPVLFEPGYFAVVGIIGFVLSLTATVYPARKASGILPARAVRYE